MFKSSNTHKKSFFLLFFLAICLLVALVGIFWQGRQVAENANISLLRPGGDVVEFVQDTTDTSVSEIKRGDPVYPASYNGDVRDLPQIGPTEKTLNVEFERVGNDLPDPGFIDPVRQALEVPNVMPSPIANFAGLDLSLIHI